MHIALDVSALDTPDFSGVQRGIVGLLRGLEQANHAHRISLVAPCIPRWLPERFRETQGRFSFSALQAPRFAPNHVWREWNGLRYCKQQGVDLWHSPIQAIPLATQNLPRVATMHELSWLHAPRTQDEGSVFKRKLQARVVSKSAKKVICPSASTKSDFDTLFPGASAKTVVIPHGLPQEFASPPTGSPSASGAIIPPKPYGLVVGRMLQRKGLFQLLESYANFNEQNSSLPFMVVVGKKNDLLHQAELYAQQLGIKDSVQFTGFVPDTTLAHYYQNARLLFIPSTSEGFGFPALEAMALGTPVLAQKGSSLEEVVEDAGLMTHFSNPQEFSRDLKEILRSGHFQKTALLQAQKFPGSAPADHHLALWEGLIR